MSQVEIREEVQISNWKLFRDIFPASLASQLVFMSIGVVNALMAAAVSLSAMAAIGMIGSVFWSFNSLAFGLLSIVLAKMSFAFGNKNYSQVGVIHRQTYYLIAIMSVIIIALDLIIAMNLHLFHMSNEVIEIAQPYMILSCINVPLTLFMMHLRNINACVGYTLPTFIVSILGLLAIVPLNVYFMKEELPFFGQTPANSAFTHIIINLLYIASLLVIFRFKRKIYFKLELFKVVFEAPNWKFIKETFKVGTPVALQFWLENSFFALVVLLVAHLGTSVLGAHEAAMSTYSVAYAIAISSSGTITSIVSRRLGEKRLDLAKKLFNNVILFLVFFNLVTGVLVIYFRELIAWEFVTDDNVALHITKNLLIFLAIANFFDAIYASFLGYLVSFRDSRFVFIVAIVVSWVLGIPIASIFALTPWFNFGIYAYWTAFIFIPLIALTICYFRLKLKWYRMDENLLYQNLAKNS
ncbi:hypothetical protein CKF54_04715 [Psittacicella hinzii]|uniref:MATE family efflux transporter n=1 Tax=Psittacicella hinzii TaxID=2028575 RepID=A0A3A1Y5C7_9GAMM|nr:MATE family efflux transporter [Psittacicella hinzii]RIY32479.1 hypothetical protein CKF54_04715 [Psittacicella hinzii]